MASFQVQIPIRFQHTDPAGLVFYPRYFEMINQLVEDWFSEALAVSFRALHLEQERAVPTVHIEMDFVQPARLGDVLDFGLSVHRLGRSAIDLDVTATRADSTCLSGRVTLVYTAQEKEQMVTQAWPQALRSRIENYMSD